VLGILVAAPWLALLPSVLFAVGYRRTRLRAVLVAAGVWLAYFLYEEGVRRRILCSGECNIRVDLLLIYPVLLVISAAAVARWRRRAQEGAGE
jgi:hypothetical protein